MKGRRGQVGSVTGDEDGYLEGEYTTVVGAVVSCCAPCPASELTLDECLSGQSLMNLQRKARGHI